MSAQNAKDAADEWIAHADLPEDLTGRTIRLITFETEEDCRFFYPRRALAWQRQVNTYISRALRPRGATIQRILVRPYQFLEWVKNQPAKPMADPNALRRQFADSFQQLL